MTDTSLAAPMPVSAASAVSVPPLASPVDEHGFALELSLRDGYAQSVDFGLPDVAPLLIDEPPPLGAAAGPNPARVLGAALASCLGASLLFCLRKAHIDVSDLHTCVTGSMHRNEQGRLRIRSILVRLEPVVPMEQHARIGRCTAMFEDYCVVTASVRPGIDVQVTVVPREPED